MQLNLNIIILFLIFVIIVKNLNLNISFFINMAILSIIIYYFYYDNKNDLLIKRNLEKIISFDNQSNNNPKIEIEPSNKIIKYLDELKLYSEEHQNIDPEDIKHLIHLTNKAFKNKSLFYKTHIIKILEDIRYQIPEKNLIKKFNNIKNKIKSILDKTIVNKDPLPNDIFRANKYNPF